jgi:serine/threonine protein phosphatase PrpC
MKHSLFPGRSFKANLVLGTPDVVRVPAPPGGILLLACDGLWDVLTPQKAASIAHGVLKSGRTVREAAIELVNRAMERGTLDNVSAIVVALPRD